MEAVNTLAYGCLKSKQEASSTVSSVYIRIWLACLKNKIISILLCIRQLTTVTCSWEFKTIQRPWLSSDILRPGCMLVPGPAESPYSMPVPRAYCSTAMDEKGVHKLYKLDVIIFCRWLSSFSHTICWKGYHLLKNKTNVCGSVYPWAVHSAVLASLSLRQCHTVLATVDL